MLTTVHVPGMSPLSNVSWNVCPNAAIANTPNKKVNNFLIRFGFIVDIFANKAIKNDKKQLKYPYLFTIWLRFFVEITTVYVCKLLIIRYEQRIIIAAVCALFGKCDIFCN